MTTADAGNREIYDVAIIGYGPTGATIANLLGLEGLKVLVVERDAEIYNQPRAIGFDHEVMRIFQAAGVAEDVLTHTGPMTSSNYIGAQGQVIREFHQIDPPYRLGWPPNYVFDQPGLEGALRAGVERYASVDVRLRHEMETFTDQGDQVTLSVRDLDRDALVDFQAKYVVAGDGARSATRQKLGIVFEDLGFDEPWLVVDVYVKDTQQFPQINLQICDPNRPMTFIVGPNNHRRWEIMLMPGETPEEIDKLPRIYELLAPFGKPEDFEIRRSATYRFHALVAANWRQGRVLLAGDAAHQTPPFIGQGMCQGIRDASALCWRLKSILKDNITDEILDSYTIERKPHVETTTIRTKGLGEEICMLDPVKAAERDRLLEEELKSGKQNTSRQGLIPGLVTGRIDLAGDERSRDRVGKLVCQPIVKTLAENEARLLDDVAGRGFWLVLNGAARQIALNEDQLRFWRRIGGEIITVGASSTAPQDCDGVGLKVQDVDGLMTDFLNEMDCDAVIVRPDRYIYGIAYSANDLTRQITDLQNWLVIDPG